MGFFRGQVVSVDYAHFGIHFLGIYLCLTESAHVIACKIPLPGRDPHVWVKRNLPDLQHVVSPCHDLRAVMEMALAYEEFLLSGRDFDW